MSSRDSRSRRSSHCRKQQRGTHRFSGMVWLEAALQLGRLSGRCYTERPTGSVEACLIRVYPRICVNINEAKPGASAPGAGAPTLLLGEVAPGAGASRDSFPEIQSAKMASAAPGLHRLTAPTLSNRPLYQSWGAEPTDPTGFKPSQPAPQKQPKLSHFYPKLSCQNQSEHDSAGFNPTLTRPFGTQRSQVQILSPRPKARSPGNPVFSGILAFFMPLKQQKQA